MSTKHRVLLIDDEPGVRFGVRDYLESHGFEVDEAQDCRSGQEAFWRNRPDIVVLDYLLPDGDALGLISPLKEADAEVPIIILTAHGSIDLAVRAIKEGADQFLTKPVDLSSLLLVLRREIENRRARQKGLVEQAREARWRAANPFVGGSAAIRALHEEARRVASANSAVMIYGETGSGKGVLARWLHRNSPRAEEPFVDLNCAGLMPELLESELFGHQKGAFTGAVGSKSGLLEMGHRGTVFLDEIGDMDLRVQPKLLTVLEEKRIRRLGDTRGRTVDIRLIAATHRNLADMAREEKFRSDLYYRINTIPLTVPPLRERKEDILVLARELLRGIASDLGRGEVTLAPESAPALERYPWPGNIRELRNVLERAVLLSSRQQLTPSELRFDATAAEPGAGEIPRDGPGVTLQEVERQHIERVLAGAGGRVEEAARRLGVPRSSLYSKLKQYGIAPGLESKP
ncbi:MAG: sigma-54 dependent transcriptional regulator [Phycisphaerales bacterium]